MQKAKTLARTTGASPLHYKWAVIAEGMEGKLMWVETGRGNSEAASCRNHSGLVIHENSWQADSSRDMGGLTKWLPKQVKNGCSRSKVLPSARAMHRKGRCMSTFYQTPNHEGRSGCNGSPPPVRTNSTQSSWDHFPLPMNPSFLLWIQRQVYWEPSYHLTI
jgi:hypothetical protein